MSFVEGAERVQLYTSRRRYAALLAQLTAHAEETAHWTGALEELRAPPAPLRRLQGFAITEARASGRRDSEHTASGKLVGRPFLNSGVGGRLGADGCTVAHDGMDDTLGSSVQRLAVER